MTNRSITIGLKAKDESLSAVLGKGEKRISKYAKSVYATKKQLDALGKERKSLAKLESLGKSSAKLEKRFRASQQRTAQLAKAVKSLDKPSASMNKRFQASIRESRDLSRAYKRQVGDLRELRSQLGGAAKSERHMALAQRKNAKATEQLTQKYRAQNKVLTERQEHKKTLSKYAKRGAVGAVVGAGYAAKQGASAVLDFDYDLTRLGVDAGIDDARVQEIKQKIIGLSTREDINIDRNELLASAKEVVTQTGNIDAATKNLEAMALAISAAGASGGDVGSLVANFYEKFLITGQKDMMNMLDTAARLANAGAFEFRDVAQQGKGISATYAATGRTGVEAVQEMLSAAQIVMRSADTGAEAATSLDRLMTTFLGEKTVMLRKAGIEVYDLEKSKDGVNVTRPIGDIVKDVLRYTKGDVVELDKIFDIKAMQAIRPFNREYQLNNGEIPSLDRFMAIKGDGGMIKENSRRMAETGRGQLKRLSNQLFGAFDSVVDRAVRNAVQWNNILLPGGSDKRTQQTLPGRPYGPNPLDAGGVLSGKLTLNLNVDNQGTRITGLTSDNPALELEAVIDNGYLGVAN